MKYFRRRHFTLALLLSLCGGFASVSYGQFFGGGGVKDDIIAKPKPAVLFVLDLSSSMAGANIQRVRETLDRTVQIMPPGAGAGLVTFSGCSLSDISLAVPLAADNASRVAAIAHASNPNPTGSTDIYRALERAESHIKSLKKKKWCVKVILLTDGLDTCHQGDPAKKAQKIANMDGQCNTVDSISIGIPQWDIEVLDRIAEMGRGKHKAAEDVGDVEGILEEELKEYLESERAKGSIDWEGDFSKDKKKKDGTFKRPTGPKDEEDDTPADDPEDLELGNEVERERGQGGGHGQR